MPKASDLKIGSVVELDGGVYIARQIEKRNPSARGASTLYRVRFINVRSGQKLEQTLKGDDFLKDGDLSKTSVQFSYREGDMITFMDTGDYSQYTLNADTLEEQLAYITEDLEGMIALLVDGEIVGRGHNRRVQEGSVIKHAEMDCLENAGRMAGVDYKNAVLYSTLSPCDMCSGAVLLYGISRVVIGENTTERRTRSWTMRIGRSTAKV